MKGKKVLEHARSWGSLRSAPRKSSVYLGTTGFCRGVAFERSVVAGVQNVPKLGKTREKRSGSRGWNRFQCGSGTAQLCVWFQRGVVIHRWHHSTYSQNRSGTTRRNARKSSPRLAGSGCGSGTAINGNSGEYGLCGSTHISSVVPVNIFGVRVEPHGKALKKDGVAV